MIFQWEHEIAGTGYSNRNLMKKTQNCIKTETITICLFTQTNNNKKNKKVHLHTKKLFVQSMLQILNFNI